MGPRKNEENKEKHHISFEDARKAWLDPSRLTAEDIQHSTAEETRFYLYGIVDGDVLTVRFTRKGNVIRIIGADYLARGKDQI
jgi:hypothetical protein